MRRNNIIERRELDAKEEKVMPKLSRKTKEKDDVKNDFFS